MFPGLVSSKVTIINGSETVNAFRRQYYVPWWSSSLTMVCVGSGGGGAAAVGSSGGSGGGSGAVSIVTVATCLLPTTLYIGGHAGGESGLAGGLSSICIAPSNTASNTICQANGGAAGSSTSSPGAGGIIMTIGLSPLAGLGNYIFMAGDGGTNGGASTGANGVDNTFFAVQTITSGGNGGAGSNAAGSFRGGMLAPITDSKLSEQRPLSVAGNFAGSDGYRLKDLFYSYGGTGGSTDGTNSGRGGAGGPGSGGGGGGGSSGISALGGKGGYSQVIFIAS